MKRGRVRFQITIERTDYISQTDEPCQHEIAWNSLCAACGAPVEKAKLAEEAEVCISGINVA